MIIAPGVIIIYLPIFISENFLNPRLKNTDSPHSREYKKFLDNNGKDLIKDIRKHLLNDLDDQLYQNVAKKSAEKRSAEMLAGRYKHLSYEEDFAKSCKLFLQKDIKGQIFLEDVCQRIFETKFGLAGDKIEICEILLEKEGMALSEDVCTNFMTYNAEVILEDKHVQLRLDNDRKEAEESCGRMVKICGAKFKDEKKNKFCEKYMEFCDRTLVKNDCLKFGRDECLEILESAMAELYKDDPVVHEAILKQQEMSKQPPRPGVRIHAYPHQMSAGKKF